MIQEVGSTPATVIGSGGWGGGEGCGWLGMLLVIALLGGGFGGFGGGYGRGHGCGDGGYNGNVDYNFLREGQYNLSKNIDFDTYEGAKNTCAIIQNDNSNTGKILEKMSQNELREAYAKIAALETSLSEQRIVASVCANAFPQKPVPAYPVPAPFPYGNGCGFGYPGYGV